MGQGRHRGILVGGLDRRGKKNVESGAVPVCGVDPENPPVFGDDGAAGRQTKAVSGGLGGEERVEDLFGEFGAIPAPVSDTRIST